MVALGHDGQPGAAHRVRRQALERSAVDDFMALTPEKARSLAMRYDLDYLVTATEMPLPEAYRNSRFHVYALRDAASAQR